MIDLLLKNVNIIDGTGSPHFRGSLAINGGKIVQVTRGDVALHACEVVQAEELTAMPGFVDIHRHGDLSPFLQPLEGEELRQGITTFLNGNCGFSAAPSVKKFFVPLCNYARPIMGEIPQMLCGKRMGAFLDATEKIPLCSNLGYLVGGGALRIAVKGFDASLMTEKELHQVCALLEDSLQAGAFGLSLGLMYVPENFYSTAELVQICSVAARYRRIVTVHMRGEGSSLLASVEEVVTLARLSGAHFHISHLKAAGKKNWNFLISSALERIERARAEGLALTFDVYPYTAGSTALYTLLPPALQQGGLDAMLARLRVPEIRAQTLQQLRAEQTAWDNLVLSTGWQSVVICGGANGAPIGKTVQQIAQERGTSPEECTMDLLLENAADVSIVFHSMREADMERVLMSNGAIVISDGLYQQGGIPHPRRYGAAARVISCYGAQLGLENAVSCVTGRAARCVGILERGTLEAGQAADILLVDLNKFADKASYIAPVAYPDGIHAVYLNGVLALDKGGHVQAAAGRLLRQNSRADAESV